MLSEVVLVKPSYFKETGNKIVTDKNGKPTVILSPVAGKIPNTAMVIAGSVAESIGILNADGSIAGDLQLVLVNETEKSEQYGRQFSVLSLDKNVASDKVMGYIKDLGKGDLIPISTPVVNNSDNVKDGVTPTLGTSKVGNGAVKQQAEVTQ